MQLIVANVCAIEVRKNYVPSRISVGGGTELWAPFGLFSFWFSYSLLWFSQ